MTLEQMLIRHEGKRSKPYKDSVGKLTIGVGRNLDDVGLSDEEITILLRNDIARVVRFMQKTYPWFAALPQGARKDALIDMVFNLGPTTFQTFTKTIEACEQGHWAEASAQMKASQWRKQVGDRALELADMVETNQYRGE